MKTATGKSKSEGASMPFEGDRRRCVECAMTESSGGTGNHRASSGHDEVFSHWVTRWAQALRLPAFRSHLTFRFSIWLEIFYETPTGQN